MYNIRYIGNAGSQSILISTDETATLEYATNNLKIALQTLA
jgi:hypothetical protein